MNNFYQRFRLLFLGIIISVTSVYLILNIPQILTVIIDLGHNIPQYSLVNDYLTGIIWSIFLGFSILLWPISVQDKKALIIVWVAKLLLALTVMLFYESYYGLDAYYYFDQSRPNVFSGTGFHIGSGTDNIMNLSYYHNLIFPDSYHMMKISYAFIGLIGIFFFYKTAQLILKSQKTDYLYWIGLFPSVIFWSSIVGKDPIVLLGISLYFFGSVCWYKSHRTQHLLLALLGATIAALIRVWLGPILIAPLLILILLSRKKVLFKFMIIALLLPTLIFSKKLFYNEFGIRTNDDIINQTSTLSRSWNYGGSEQVISIDFTDWKSMVIFAPIGIFSALFRPLPFEVNNFFGIMAGIENVFLLTLVVIGVSRIRKRHLINPVFQWSVLLILLWSTIYGFVSYQNLGTSVRFRLQILPILICVILYLLDTQKRERFKE